MDKISKEKMASLEESINNKIDHKLSNFTNEEVFYISEYKNETFLEDYFDYLLMIDKVKCNICGTYYKKIYEASHNRGHYHKYIKAMKFEEDNKYRQK